MMNFLALLDYSPQITVQLKGLSTGVGLGGWGGRYKDDVEELPQSQTITYQWHKEENCNASIKGKQMLWDFQIWCL